MIVRSVRHRGLLRLIEDDGSRELRNDLMRRLRNAPKQLASAPAAAPRPTTESANEEMDFHGNFDSITGFNVRLCP
jgi:hypothetical protein